MKKFLKTTASLVLSSFCYSQALFAFQSPSYSYFPSSNLASLSSISIQDSITYIDPGAGKDKQNQIVTLDKQNFLKGFRGNVTLENTFLAAQALEDKTLSSQETQKIRGAFLFFLIPAIFAAITNIGAAVWAVINGIGTILAAVGSLVSGAFSSITGALTSIANGIGYVGSAIFKSISFAASSLFHAIGNVGSFLSQQVFGSLAKAGFGNTLFQNAVKIGINYGVNKGLTALGVDPQIASFVSAFVTGTYQGLTGPISAIQLAQGVTRASLIASNIFQSLTLEGIGFIGQELNLDPQLTNIISLSVAAIGGQVIESPTTTLEQAFLNVRGDIFSSLASYGVTEVATSLGLNSSFSSLIASPFSFGINASFNGNSVITAVQQGILAGTSSIAMDYLIDEAGIDPLLGSITSSAITGAINGALGGDILGGVFRSFNQSVLSLSSLGIQGNSPWSQAQYLQRVQDFSTKIQERGLAQAIDDYATAIFHESTISNILQSYATVKDFIQAKINTGDVQAVTVNGQNRNRIQLANGDWVDLSADYSDVTSIKRGFEQLTGEFGVSDYGVWGLTNGTSILTYQDGTIVTSSINEGNLIEIYIAGPEELGLSDFLIKRAENELGINFNPDGSLRDGDIESGGDFRLSLRDGLLEELQDSGTFEIDFGGQGPQEVTLQTTITKTGQLKVSIIESALNQGLLTSGILPTTELISDLMSYQPLLNVLLGASNQTVIDTDNPLFNAATEFVDQLSQIEVQNTVVMPFAYQSISQTLSSEGVLQTQTRFGGAIKYIKVTQPLEFLQYVTGPTTIAVHSLGLIDQMFGQDLTADQMLVVDIVETTDTETILVVTAGLAFKGAQAGAAIGSTIHPLGGPIGGVVGLIVGGIIGVTVAPIFTARLKNVVYDSLGIPHD